MNCNYIYIKWVFERNTGQLDPLVFISHEIKQLTKNTRLEHSRASDL